MSADRYEIDMYDDGAFIITNLNGHRFIVDANCVDIRSRAIRQQARDIAELRADYVLKCTEYNDTTEFARGLIAERDELRGEIARHERNNTHIGKMFDQLRADLAAAVAELAWLRSNTKQSATFDLWFLDASESEETVESTLFGPARDIGRMQEALRYLDATIIERNKLFNALNRAGFTECDALLKFITERDALKLRAEQAEARLAAIDSAPTVAVVLESNRDFCKPHRYLNHSYEKMPPLGTELIARPAKD